ncbi:uncharacterized protein LOC125051342 [Pieris napi]|uniref:uncharacterized protein LOC125051342 n=1 Tax=Pieris napi TaxID=78633 RepID=UPI001FB8C7A0|nr:uncharacterized protein LOC125051342 [Pieris napi]
MANLIHFLVLFGCILVCICQDYDVQDTLSQEQSEVNPSYSFGYGVSDAQTGDVKTVWESKDGDTFKGHYSVIEPDGSMRTVEYSAGPDTGFIAANSDANQNEPLDSPLPNPDLMEDKALRDYDRYYDFSEDADLDPPYKTNEKKRKRYPYETQYNDYSYSKRPKHPSDLDASEYTHSINIKHPRDDGLDSPHSHMGYSTDPNCNKKHKPESNYYGSIADLDFRKQKYPPYQEPTKYDSDKYKSEASSIDSEKYINSYRHGFKPLKPDEYNEPQTKYGYPNLHDLPTPESYSDYLPPRPKKKFRPHRIPDSYDPENLDDYVLVPKRKLKKPQRIVDDYQPEPEEDFDHRIPYSAYDDEYEDDRYQRPSRGPTGPQKEEKIVKKIVKKKPVINILDIFDI